MKQYSAFYIGLAKERSLEITYGITRCQDPHLVIYLTWGGAVLKSDAVAREFKYASVVH